MLGFAFPHLDVPGQAMGLGKTKVRDDFQLSSLLEGAESGMTLNSVYHFFQTHRVRPGGLEKLVSWGPAEQEEPVASLLFSIRNHM
jgi:hypothetical protein